MPTPHTLNRLQSRLGTISKRWLVTGVAGFIGSNILETLLLFGHRVVGLDNFLTGHRANLDEVRRNVGPEAWSLFEFVEGDVCDPAMAQRCCEGVDFVLHHAALGSVPRSIHEPLTTNHNNVTGFLTMLTASQRANVRRFVYAASSSTYGDSPNLPKTEGVIGKPLSPYAVTKYVNELYADVFGLTYGMECIGLRYFNIFGPRQDPNGAYAAVIPLWFNACINNSQAFINGDGLTSRDFCFVDNAVEANILAALAPSPDAVNQVYNIAYGQQTTLKDLFILIRDLVAARLPHAAALEPVMREFRAGDVRHSLANIDKARALLGYDPQYQLHDGLKESVSWYFASLSEGEPIATNIDSRSPGN